MDRHRQLTVLIIVLLGNLSVINSSNPRWDFSSVNNDFNKNGLEEKLTDTDFNTQLLNVFKDELQEMRKDLTASFLEEHIRRKRGKTI